MPRNLLRRFFFSTSILLLASVCFAQRRAGIGAQPAPAASRSAPAAAYSRSSFSSRPSQPAVGGANRGYSGHGYPHTGYPFTGAPHYANRRNQRSSIYVIPVWGGYYGAYGPSYSDSYLNTPYGSAPYDPDTLGAQPPVADQAAYSAGPPPGEDQPSIGVYQQSGGLPQTEPGYSSVPETEENYLLAFKDHSVYSATSYWFEGATMHYLTVQHAHNQADVSQVDIDLTRRLNQDHAAPFEIPATVGTPPAP